MTETIYSAPGKLVLIGEYAVTQGLPALSMAINRRAIVKRDTYTDQSHCLFTSMAPQTSFNFELSRGHFQWQKTPPESIRKFVELLPWPATQKATPGIQLSLNTDQFYLPDSDQKIGLGSSAALMLAATVALGGDYALACKQHQQLQGQLGSGIDLASSYNGGLIYFQQQQSEPLQLPADFYWRAVWTENSAQTSQFVKSFQSWHESQPERWQQQREYAAILIAAAITACGNGDSLGLLANLRAYGEWMRDLGLLIGEPIYTQEHETLRKLALSTGNVWKPSGAGGGDIGIICAQSRQKLKQICQTITESGYTILDLEPDMDGLKPHQ